MLRLETERPGRLLAFYNPYATYGEEAEAFIDSLVEQKPLGLSVFKRTTEPTLGATIEMLKAELEGDDELAIASGDGGLDTLLKGLMALEAQNPVATFVGGNKDDLPRMLHSKKTLQDPEAVLRSKIVPLRAVRSEITPPHSPTEVLHGFGYLTIGITGDISERTCDPATRELLRKLDKLHLGKFPRMTIENWIGLKAIAHAIPMTLVEDDTGHERPVLEYNVLNGDRQGGMKLIRKGDLLDDRAGILEIGGKGPRSLGRAVRQILQSDLDWVKPGETRSFTLFSTTDHAAEVGGEAKRYTSGTHYQIGLEDDSHTVNVRSSLAA